MCERPAGGAAACPRLRLGLFATVPSALAVASDHGWNVVFFVGWCVDLGLWSYVAVQLTTVFQARPRSAPAASMADRPMVYHTSIMAVLSLSASSLNQHKVCP